MASSSKLKFLDVLNAVDSLNYEQTKDLFVRLGVDLKVITDIEATNKGSSCIKHHTIQAWLDRDTEASWEKIVYELEQIGYCKKSSRTALPSLCCCYHSYH